MFVDEGSVGVLHWQRRVRRDRLNIGGICAGRLVYLQCSIIGCGKRADWRKNDWMWVVPRVAGTLVNANSHFDPPQSGSRTAQPG